MLTGSVLSEALSLWLVDGHLLPGSFYRLPSVYISVSKSPLLIRTGGHTVLGATPVASFNVNHIKDPSSLKTFLQIQSHSELSRSRT